MKKLLFFAAMMFALCLQALPAPAQAAAQPFVRWSVYSAAAGNGETLWNAVTAYNSAAQQNSGVLAIYGGEDTEGIIRFLEIYKDEAAFNAVQKDAALQNELAKAKELASVYKVMPANAFLLQSKLSGTADKARMAMLVIDPAQLDSYKKILAEEIRGSVANEPGVLALLATTEAARPNVFHLLELYADDEAYKAHIAGPYFQKYNTGVQSMVTDKKLTVNKPQDVTLSGKTL